MVCCGVLRFFGLPATGATRAWIPTIIFASLFGLSMDYEVFVLTRIREEYDRTGATDQAVVAGLARPGRLVTRAAMILTVTFPAISLGPDQLVKIVATTRAVGIIVDAVIVRTLLIPAIVALMGRWNWWVPSALAKIVGVERA
jgi:putative drug exporter of the RND superfamily